MSSHTPPDCRPSHSEQHPECCFTGNLGFASWNDTSTQLKTVYYFLQGLRDWNFDMLEPTLSDEFRMEILPRSLGAPMRTREDWLRTCKESSILEPGYRIDIVDINESPGRIWIHATVYARAKTGQAYENEYLLMFRIENPDVAGEAKITELKQFMDSLYTTNFALDVGSRRKRSSTVGGNVTSVGAFGFCGPTSAQNNGPTTSVSKH